MALEVVDSNSITHPLQYDPLAQLVEHLTFNQGVLGSSPRWIKYIYDGDDAVFFYLIAQRSYCNDIQAGLGSL